MERDVGDEGVTFTVIVLTVIVLYLLIRRTNNRENERLAVSHSGTFNCDPDNNLMRIAAVLDRYVAEDERRCQEQYEAELYREAMMVKQWPTVYMKKPVKGN